MPGTSASGQDAAQPAAGEPAVAPEPAAAPEPTPPLGRRRIGILVAVALFVLAADVITKIVVVAKLSGRPPVHVIGTFLQLTLLRNSGAAFSIGTGMTFVFTAIAVGVIIFILRTARRLRSLPWAITLGLLLGGAMGNLSDRIFRGPAPRGFVVDWIELPHWPVFNLADSAIVCGGVLTVLLALLGLRLDGTRENVLSHQGASTPSGDAGPTDPRQDG